MLRNRFQKEMDALNLELTQMAALIEKIISDGTKALMSQDMALCEQVISYRDEVKTARAEIESKALKIILVQQPVAGDLRKISTALKMITDLERIASQARDICEIILFLGVENYQVYQAPEQALDMPSCDGLPQQAAGLEPGHRQKNALASKHSSSSFQIKLEILPQMGELTRQMVFDCVNSFVKQDLELADKTIEKDNQLDALFDNLRKKMIKLIKEKPSFADQAIYLLMIGKYLEKIGDHAENIAQWVIFAKTGERKSVKIL